MNQKLTQAQITELRQRYARGGISVTALAAQYGIHKGHASRIVRGKSGNQPPVVPAHFQRILDGLR